jgi:alpha-glucosidase
MNDGGYDISDYRRVDPIFGTNDDAVAFIDGCHERGLGVVMDLVANHCSIEHEWFQAALRSPAGSPERQWFYFLDGRGENGAEPPTDWISVFGGSAWTHESAVGGAGGQWYLNLFDSSQPDLNWGNLLVAEAFDEIIRFWCDLGVDGFRLDAIPAIGKADHFGDIGFTPGQQWDAPHWPPMPFWDADGVHEVMRRWRTIADSYDPPRHLIGEVLVGSHERLAHYVRPDELHSVFSIGVSTVQWDADELCRFINDMTNAIAPTSSWLTWTLSSHDEVRTASRYTETAVTGLVDDELGRARSRALHMVLFALPGAACLYQGEELGLNQVTDIPDELLQDPIFLRTGDRRLSRDGCRVPMPWTRDGATLGFNDREKSWLPQPASWRDLSAQAQAVDEDSFLNFVRRLISVRQSLVGDLSPSWRCWSEGGVVFVERGEQFRCVLNTSATPFGVSNEWRVLLASGEKSAVTEVAPQAAAWLRHD